MAGLDKVKICIEIEALPSSNSSLLSSSLVFLAAIVIVAYNGITDSAHKSTVKNDLSEVAKKLELYRVENGSYPEQDITQLENADLSFSKGSYRTNRNNVYYCRSNDGQHYSFGIYAVNDTRYYLTDGSVTETTENIYGEGNCNKLPGGAGAVGTGINQHPQYSSSGHVWDTNTNTGSWRSWTE